MTQNPNNNYTLPMTQWWQYFSTSSLSSSSSPIETLPDHSQHSNFIYISCINNLFVDWTHIEKFNANYFREYSALMAACLLSITKWWWSAILAQGSMPIDGDESMGGRMLCRALQHPSAVNAMIFSSHARKRTYDWRYSSPIDFSCCSIFINLFFSHSQITSTATDCANTHWHKHSTVENRQSAREASRIHPTLNLFILWAQTTFGSMPTSSREMTVGLLSMDLDSDVPDWPLIRFQLMSNFQRWFSLEAKNAAFPIDSINRRTMKRFQNVCSHVCQCMTRHDIIWFIRALSDESLSFWTVPALLVQTNEWICLIRRKYSHCFDQWIDVVDDESEHCTSISILQWPHFVWPFCLVSLSQSSDKRTTWHRQRK